MELSNWMLMVMPSCVTDPEDDSSSSSHHHHTWRSAGRDSNGRSAISASYRSSVWRELSNSPQSIFISGIGNATITKRNCTANDEFLVLQYTGSSPGIWPNSGNNWQPRGYINFVVETTAYFVNPDGLPAEGMPGSALPYPITTAYSPIITDYIPDRNPS